MSIQRFSFSILARCSKYSQRRVGRLYGRVFTICFLAFSVAMAVMFCATDCAFVSFTQFTDTGVLLLFSAKYRAAYDDNFSVAGPLIPQCVISKAPLL